MKLTVEDVIDKIGEFGFQQKVYLLLIMFLHLFLAFHQLQTIFTGLDPSFKCIDKKSIGNDTVLKILSTCPENSVDRCNLKYDSTYVSFAQEWNLVCNEKYKVALVQSVWMAGVMTGPLCLGGVADIIGRSKTFMLSLISLIFFEGCSGFATSYLMHIILRYIGGIANSLLIIATFVLMQELVGNSSRSICGMALSSAFAMGIAGLSWIASMVAHWRTLSIVTAVAGVLFLWMPFYIPESPRWLAGEGRLAEARSTLICIAKGNKMIACLPSSWELVSATNTKGGKAKGAGVRDLFTHPYMLLLTLIQIYAWFVNSAVYYALTLAAGSLQGNVYISTAINGLVEMPAVIAAIFIIDRYGRLPSICGFMFGGGISCILILFLASILPSSTNILALIGKLCISASFATIYIHSGEIFPTPVRNTGMSVVSVAARVGGIISPFVLMLGDLIPNIQFLLLGCLTFLGGVISLKLPETLGWPMPESVGEVVGRRNQKLPDDKVSEKTKRSKATGKYDEDKALLIDEDDNVAD